MRLMGFVVLVALAAAVAAAGQASPGNPESAVWMERGKAALAEYRYYDAAEAFQKAVAISPDLAAAHAQLARALLGEAPLNPLLFPDTQGFLTKALAAARKAVELSPADPEALSALATVDHKLADSTRDPGEKAVRLAEVISLWNKILAADSRSAEAHTELARIAIEHVGWPIVMARTRSGMAFGERGPVRDATLRRGLQEQYGHTIDEAMIHARKALELNPAYVPAMRAMSGALMMRAGLGDSEAAYAADFKASEDWQQKAAAAAPKPAQAPGPSSNIGGLIGAMISQTPVPPGTTTMIFALPSAAERNLLTKIEPSYPDAAKKAGVQGNVLFRAVIGTDGHVRTLDLVRGDPLLVKAAEDAARKWVYRPFAGDDGIARDAATEISISFKLEKQ